MDCILQDTHHYSLLWRVPATCQGCQWGNKHMHLLKPVFICISPRKKSPRRGYSTPYAKDTKPTKAKASKRAENRVSVLIHCKTTL